METTNDRSRLAARLREVLGPGGSETLMRHLPQHDAGDLALREDVAHLGERLEAVRISFEARFEGLENRLDRMEHDVAHLGERVDRLEQRMDRLEQRMDRLEQRMDALLDRLVDIVPAIEAVRGDVRKDINEAVLRSNRTTVLAMAGTIVGSASLATIVMATFGL